VPIHASGGPPEEGAGGEANDDPSEETASDAVDDRDQEDTERKRCEPRQVPSANVRPSRVALSGLRMRVTEGAFVAEPVLDWSVYLSSSRSLRGDSAPSAEPSSRKRGTNAKTTRLGQYERRRTLPLSA
jgi:hypothetical protein